MHKCKIPFLDVWNDHIHHCFKVLLILSVGLVVGCHEAGGLGGDGAETQSIAESVAQNASSGRIAASLDGNVITMAEVDHAIQLPLYDLERAKFDLRALELRKLIQAQPPGSEKLEVFLQPPLPPRIDLPQPTIPTDGMEGAPVTLAIFCSFQSIHCVRQQDIWQQLRDQYGALIRWQAYDYPLEVHRYGRIAANAARCAGDQQQYWRYFRSLFSFYDDLTDSRYRMLARQLALDLSAFEQCLEDLRYRDQVEADISVGAQLGLSNVPVVFINGLYISGPQPIQEYQRWIDWELNRLGIQQAEKKGHESSSDRMSGDDVAEEVGSVDNPAPTSSPHSTSGRVMAPSGTIEVSRDWLMQQLENREQLATKFQSAEHEVEGYKLMRLEAVSELEFFQVLGLQDQDVLLRVGEEWLHEGQNPLWDSLAQLTDKPGEVSLMYFRNGLPQHIKVEVQ
ncbi:thioredoxin domain-containing protein [Hahella ganghwensis]|uniref:thioredoxin domain-containing protein n=1 Tax=Hahella ganghwensis TaxID=286420 RepID=UPI00036FC436|nr:thioredoxin domain-containing protein [Hahella ganghwensis]